LRCSEPPRAQGVVDDLGARHDWVKGGLATFAPPLDQAGNSVRGQLATRFLSRALGLDIFMSRTEHAGTDT
jgi:hypothetical protein